MRSVSTLAAEFDPDVACADVGGDDEPHLGGVLPILLDDPHFYMELTDKGIVFVVVKGDFNDAIVDRFEKESEPHMQRLAPVLYMNDMSQAGDAPLSAKWKVSDLMKRRAHLVKASAVFGISGARKLLAKTLLRASGRSGVVGVHETRDQAEAWLLAQK